MIKKSKFIQTITAQFLIILGVMSFIALIADENPYKPISLLRFFLIKAAAVLSLILCFIIGKWLNKNGYIPDVEE